MSKNNVTRKELAASITEKLGVSHRNAANIVDTVFSTLKNTLVVGNPSSLSTSVVSSFEKNLHVEDEIHRQVNQS